MMVKEDGFYLCLNFLYYVVFVIAILYSISLDVSGKLTKVGYVLSKKLIIFTLVIFSFIVGFRDLNIGSDTLSYYGIWENIETFDFEGEYMFAIVMYVLRRIGLSFNFFLFFIVILFCFYLYKSYLYFGEKYKIHPFLVLFTFMSFFFFESLTVNVIRQGLSLIFLLYAWTVYIVHNSNRRKIYLFLFLSVITHSISVVPILLYLAINKFDRNIDITRYVFLYFIGVFLSAMNIGVLTIAPFLTDMLQDSRRIGYLTEKSDLYTIGFKPQFVFFNTIFLLCGWYVMKRMKESLWYRNLFKFYVLSSFLFFMCFQIPYSDRVGLYSWVVIPIMLGPFFSYKENRIALSTIVCLCLFLLNIFLQFYYKA